MIAFLGGLIIGFVGSARGWSGLRTFFTAFLWGFVCVFLSVSAQSSEIGLKTLRENTLHVNVGSAFIYKGSSGKTYMVTNFHVCNASHFHGKMQGSFNDGTSVVGKIVKSDPLSDLCAIQVKTSRKGIVLAPRLAPFDEIDTRGYPEHIPSESHGQFLGKTNWTYMYVISDIGTCFKGSHKRYDDRDHLYGCEVDFTSNVSNLYSRPGASGSPVVNQEGQLVGVISSWAHDRDDSAGMVPLEQLTEFVKGL
jgi:S1-C subfamily serine protease